MAISIQNSDHLQKIHRKYLRRSILGFFGALLCFLVFLLTMNLGKPALLYGSLGALLLCMALGGAMWKKANIYAAGVRGEYTLLHILEALPDSWHLFSNVKLTWKDQTCEMDMVAVGPTGVFVIENKNQKGTVWASPESRNWNRQKNDRRDSFYSPVRQVKTHIYVLANVLRSQGLGTYVEGAVFFSHPQAEVKGAEKFSDIPVFCLNAQGDKALLSHLKNRPKALPPAQLQKICNIMDGSHSR